MCTPHGACMWLIAGEYDRAGSLDRGHRYSRAGESRFVANDAAPVFPAGPRPRLGAPGCRITAASSAATKVATAGS